MRTRWTGFQSPLAEGIARFLAHKRALGRRYDVEEQPLRLVANRRFERLAAPARATEMST